MSASDFTRVQNQIGHAITALRDQQLPSNIGSNADAYQRLEDQIADLKATRGRLNVASTKDFATRQAEMNRAILRHGLHVPPAAAAAAAVRAPAAAAAAAAPAAAALVPSGGPGASPASGPSASSTAPPRSISGAPPGGGPGPGGVPDPGGGTTTREEDPCPICLSDMNDGTPIHVGPCGHRIHRTCYNHLPSPWTTMPKLGQKVCPICRYNAVVPGPLVEPLRSQQGYGKYRSTRYVM
jgi:hypothetical protein